MKSKRKLLFVVLGTVCWLVLGTIGIMPAVMSPMMFDSGEAFKSVPTWMAFWGIFSFPPICLLVVVSAWGLFAFNQRVWAAWLMLLPLANILAVTAAITWLSLTGHG